ncbi:MAG: CHC2 zinc finger domain-containing protein [Bacillota bacterium]
MLKHSLSCNSIFGNVRAIPFLDVVQAFLPGVELRRGKMLCPFHSEKIPSFHVYDAAGHCYSCGWHGDGVAFVAELLSLQPLDTARRIAAVFGIPTVRKPTRAEWQQYSEVQRKRDLERKYQGLENRAFIALARYRDLIVDVFKLDGLDIPADLVDAIHELPKIEHYLHVLAIGNPEQKLELLREGVIGLWANVYSLQQMTKN